MALRTDWSQANCPIARSVEVLADPWTVLILREIFVGNTRFGGLRESIGIAENTLASRLKDLVGHGLLRQAPYSGSVRPRYEYELTDAGKDTLPVLHALAGWGKKHSAAPIIEQMKIFCTVCGTESMSSGWCAACKAPLVVATTAWERSATNWVRESLSRK
jgi:DNA-binding HxlR family transcriptional regulator